MRDVMLSTDSPRAMTPRGSLSDYEQQIVEILGQSAPSVAYIFTESAGHVVTNKHVIAGALMLISSGLFACVGEPQEASGRRVPASFRAYLGQGGAVFREYRSFRRFVFAQWWGRRRHDGDALLSSSESNLQRPRPFDSAPVTPH